MTTGQFMSTLEALRTTPRIVRGVLASNIGDISRAMITSGNFDLGELELSEAVGNEGSDAQLDKRLIIGLGRKRWPALRTRAASFAAPEEGAKICPTRSCGVLTLSSTYSPCSLGVVSAEGARVLAPCTPCMRRSIAGLRATSGLRGGVRSGGLCGVEGAKLGAPPCVKDSRNASARRERGAQLAGQLAGGDSGRQWPLAASTRSARQPSQGTWSWRGRRAPGVSMIDICQIRKGRA